MLNSTTRVCLGGILLSSFFVACGGGHIGRTSPTPLTPAPTGATTPPTAAGSNAAAPNSSGASNGASSPTNGTTQTGSNNQPTSNVQERTITDIQSLPNWTWCSQKRGGSVCAAGLGNADSSLLNDQQTPSLGGSSSMFWIGGPTPYSNALWWRTLDVSQSATHFTYDTFFYLEDPTAPEALEFDTNQSYGNIRYTWGTECSYKNTGKWDIWDPKNEKWVTTNVPCNQVSANAWHHLIWQFEKANGQVHYIGVSVDGNYAAVDQYFGVQQNRPGNESDVAFQMDGDFQQKAYKVWIDHLSLTTW